MPVLLTDVFVGRFGSFGGQELVVDVVAEREGDVVRDKERPPEEAGPAGLVEFLVAARPDVGIVGPIVGPDFTPVDVTGAAVDRDAPRVSMAHRVDLGPRPGRARRKEVAGGNRVGAVGLGMNAEDLAAQVVRVRRAPLIVPRRPAGAFVRLRTAAVGGVVADGDVQISGRIPGHPSARVAALLALDRVFEKDLERSRHDARSDARRPRSRPASRYVRSCAWRRRGRQT